MKQFNCWHVRQCRRSSKENQR